MTDNIITARLFIDMDGTLAAWQQAACFEDLLQENYFRGLPPYQTVVDAVRILCNAHPELDIYALSAFMPENPAAVGEKYGWLDVYVPEIDAAHRIFVPCGESKAAAAANRLKMPCIDKSFVLLDDYSAPNIPTALASVLSKWMMCKPRLLARRGRLSVLTASVIFSCTGTMVPD